MTLTGKQCAHIKFFAEKWSVIKTYCYHVSEKLHFLSTVATFSRRDKIFVSLVHCSTQTSNESSNWVAPVKKQNVLALLFECSPLKDSFRISNMTALFAVYIWLALAFFGWLNYLF